MAGSDVTDTEGNAVYDILVKYCSAPESDREAFILHQTTSFVREWRFVGSLGFGGKVYRTDARGRWRVSLYREDETPERITAMALANEALLRVEVEGQVADELRDLAQPKMYDVVTIFKDGSRSNAEYLSYLDMLAFVDTLDKLDFSECSITPAGT